MAYYPISSEFEIKIMCAAQKLIALVVSHEQVAPCYFRLRFASVPIARSAQAGQFVHILPRSAQVCDPLLRRAFSILSVKDDTFEILYKAIGKGTDQMSQWPVGYEADIIGPLGRPFSITEESLDPQGVPILVGGGVGVPPLAMLASQLPLQKKIALIGARSQDDVLCYEDFAQYSIQTEVATEDGSRGYKGLITDLLKVHLEAAQRKNICPHVYSCGPLPMLRAVAAICLQASVPCQISLEENMPCGIGICNGCVVPVVGTSDEYGRYRRICVEGPVMQAGDVDWQY